MFVMKPLGRAYDAAYSLALRLVDVGLYIRCLLRGRHHDMTVYTHKVVCLSCGRVRNI